MTSDRSPPAVGGASRVAAGILASRLLGFVRDMVLARYLGASAQLDVFRQAMRSGNLIQNLLGEQTLSAAFIPQYSRLLEEGREEEAGRFAGAIFGLLLVVSSLLALAGVFLAEPIVALFNAGYLQDAARVAAGAGQIDRFPLAVKVVRLLFPMAGLLVLSAWSVGVLNSHRRFFVAYFAPVIWNVAILSALWLAGGAAAAGGEAPAVTLERIVLAGAFGALVGGGLQFLVQLPFVARVLRGFRLSVSTRTPGVRGALRAFWPMLAGRGAVQLSGHLDGFIASFLAPGAQGILGFALTLYLLPLSLFGLSVAAAELPEMSRRRGAKDDDVAARVLGTVRRSSFFVIPTALGYVCFGLPIVTAIYGRGAFGRVDCWLMYLVLAAYSLGLPASGVTRQLNTVFYAAGRTRVPARVGVERVLLSAGSGGLLAWILDRFEVGAVVGAGGGKHLFLGAVGLAIGGALGAWYELVRIRRGLRAERADVVLPVAPLLRMAGCAAAAALPAALLWYVAGDALGAWGRVLALATVYAVGYLGLADRLGVSELAAWRAGLPGRRKG
ncbi:MAG: murein biosynthesis integral membrane protein MurJ [Acidobacteriota bacterium]|nr:murein biosynthesis integral membrane protein MurJ [Acidobacteriota bacterium]